MCAHVSKLNAAGRSTEEDWGTFAHSLPAKGRLGAPAAMPQWVLDHEQKQERFNKQLESDKSVALKKAAAGDVKLPNGEGVPKTGFSIESQGTGSNRSQLLAHPKLPESIPLSNTSSKYIC